MHPTPVSPHSRCVGVGGELLHHAAAAQKYCTKIYNHQASPSDTALRFGFIHFFLLLCLSWILSSLSRVNSEQQVQKVWLGFSGSFRHILQPNTHTHTYVPSRNQELTVNFLRRFEMKKERQQGRNITAVGTNHQTGSWSRWCLRLATVGSGN